MSPSITTSHRRCFWTLSLKGRCLIHRNILRNTSSSVAGKHEQMDRFCQSYSVSRAQPGIAADRFAPEIVRFLKALPSALAAAECQPVGRLLIVQLPHSSTLVYDAL